MQIEETAIPDVKIIVPKRFGDLRGFFSETYNRKLLANAGIDLDFVQDNHSLSEKSGVLRGLHYQTARHAQDKLVRVTRGAVLDIAVDIRRDSPTFRHHVSTVISAENWKQVFVPKGFAHGFVTLQPNTEVIYKVTAYYAPDHERGILWNDPDLAIDWGLDPASAILSPRDRVHPRCRDASDLS